MRALQTCANVGIRVGGQRGLRSRMNLSALPVTHAFSLGYGLTRAEARLFTKVSVSLEFRGSYGFHKFFHSLGNVLEALWLRFASQIPSQNRVSPRSNSEVTRAAAAPEVKLRAGHAGCGPAGKKARRAKKIRRLRRCRGYETAKSGAKRSETVRPRAGPEASTG